MEEEKLEMPIKNVQMHQILNQIFCLIYAKHDIFLVTQGLVLVHTYIISTSI